MSSLFNLQMVIDLSVEYLVRQTKCAGLEKKKNAKPPFPYAFRFNLPHFLEILIEIPIPGLFHLINHHAQYASTYETDSLSPNGFPPH